MSELPTILSDCMTSVGCRIGDKCMVYRTVDGLVGWRDLSVEDQRACSSLGFLHHQGTGNVSGLVLPLFRSSSILYVKCDN